MQGLRLLALAPEQRQRFHDGNFEPDAAIELACPSCARALRVPALAAADAGAAWFAALIRPEQEQIAELFGLRLRSPLPDLPLRARSAEQRPAHLFRLSCDACTSRLLLAFEFGERQPQRWVGQLLGLARL